MVLERDIRRHDFITGHPKWKILGFKNKTVLEAGYIYAPYVPIITPEEFEPRRNISSRYATTSVNNNFYGTIRI